MPLFNIFIISSLFLDAAAGLAYRNNTISLGEFVQFHSMSIVFILYSTVIMREHFHQYTRKISILLCCFSIFVPFLGSVAAYCIINWLRESQKKFLNPTIYNFKLKNMVEKLNVQHGIGGLAVTLKSPNIPLVKRTNALMTIGEMHPEKINNLVRTMLPEKEDELRLLAFNLIKKQQNKILPNINNAVELLENETDSEKIAILHKWLAYQYWELIYRNLLDPEIVKFTIDKTIYYIQLSLDFYHDDPDLYFIMGRLYLMKNELKQSLQAFEQSSETGMPEDRILIYIAEIYYKQNKFNEVKKCISRLASLSTLFSNKRLIMFWDKKDAV